MLLNRLNDCNTLIFEKLFGLALLVTSAMYLKELNNWSYWNACVTTINESDNINGLIQCSNFNTWRTAAIIGIIIVIDLTFLHFGFNHFIVIDFRVSLMFS